MSFIEYWQLLVAKNPKLGGGHDIKRMSVESFRRCLQAAFEAGEREASDKGKCLVGELEQILGMKE